MSDIFNDFAKIAIEQGLISEAKDKDVGEKTNMRFDSLSDDDIRSLYGVKPDGEDTKHILDQAHPESVVVSPAYDRMNGLVENLFERQDIMAWIATKPNDGKHTNERYVKASQDLTMALLNTAFMLDKVNELELMKLADNCADRLTKSAIAIVPLIYLGAAGLSAMGLINNFGGMLDNGVLSNSERAIEELNDLIADQEMPGKEDDIQDLIRDIQYVKQLNEELTSLNIDGSQAEDKVKAEVEAGQDLLKKYIKGVRHLNSRISSVLSMAEAQGREQGASSWLSTNLGDLGVGIEKIWGSLWGDDIRDALVILDTLKESLTESIASMSKLYHSIKSKVESGEQESLEEVLKTKIDQPEEEVLPSFDDEQDEPKILEQ